ncbi:MAG: 5-(carboxyamino)imidazole ribonucleotide mutase [Candidatus Micrarchaeota archaeon]|nr:5-(carboxyamino)imidazole ribonucleotide mutase [Candidatus Micrarchaeota archaeon]
MTERVLILSGSSSDKPIIDKITQVLDAFGVIYKYEVASAHRNPEKVDQLIATSTADVFIGVAGMSAALPGVIAARTIKPVIGVPVNASLDGLDALLSTVQMPPNVPVAAVGIDAGKNAGILAVQILAINDEVLKKKLVEFKESLKK